MRIGFLIACITSLLTLPFLFIEQSNAYTKSLSVLFLLLAASVSSSWNSIVLYNMMKRRQK
ncbi:MAG: hypothetical protein JW795_07275 [Chitinivibrionales bacterium]|nr:hypothetical protein [Chitinivibrionales bacterium]